MAHSKLIEIRQFLLVALFLIKNHSFNVNYLKIHLTRVSFFRFCFLPILIVWIQKQKELKKKNKSQTNKNMRLSLQAFHTLCLFEYACAISTLILLISNRLWAHRASEMPKDLIACGMDLDGVAFEPSYNWIQNMYISGCLRAHLVVVGVSLFFCFCFNVCLMQNHVIWKAWVLRSEMFQGV